MINILMGRDISRQDGCIDVLDRPECNVAREMMEVRCYRVTGLFITCLSLWRPPTVNSRRHCRNAGKAPGRTKSGRRPNSRR
jgi:hypothetical protein